MCSWLKTWQVKNQASAYLNARHMQPPTQRWKVPFWLVLAYLPYFISFLLPVIVSHWGRVSPVPICSFHKSCRAVGWPLLCPLCCPYALPPATPRPSPPPHSVFPAAAPNSQVQKQLELVNRLCVNWGWKILYQSQRSRGMEQLREEAGLTESGLEGQRTERMR